MPNIIMRLRNLAAEKILKESPLSLAPDLQHDKAEAVRSILQQGMAEGKHPYEVALNLVGRIDPKTQKRVGGILTLSKAQIEEKQKIKNWLEMLDPCYLTVPLRDKRYDRTVKKAIENNTPLSPEKIDRLVRVYENKSIKQRAENLAQTEMMRALSHAKYESSKKAIEDGLIKSKYLKKYWEDLTGECPLHKDLEERYGSKNPIPFDEPFTTSSGAKMMYPGDQSLGAPLEEICLCCVEYRYDFLEAYLEEE